MTQENWNERFERAERERDMRRREQNKKNSMDRLDRNFTRQIPDDTFQRLRGVSTREQAVWTCEDCGESPEPTRYANGFVPEKCACQRAAIEQEKADQKREAQEQKRFREWQRAQEQQRAQCAQCYCWLGQEWGSHRMQALTFESFDMDLQPDAFAAAVKFARDQCGNLVLWSLGCGTGKTHLAAAICNHLLNQGIACRFTTAQGLFDAFAARMDDHHGYSDLLAQASKAPLLFIDDLDAMHLTSYKQSVFFEVLNQRYLCQRPTIFTTNARVEITESDVVGISEYVGKKAASRLCDRANGGLTVIEMNGEDYRRRERM